VDWFPLGGGAFEKAKAEDKPVFFVDRVFGLPLSSVLL